MAAISQSVGLFGVTGELGRAFLRALEDQPAFVGRLRLFASEASSEETRLFRDRPLMIESLETADVSDLNEGILCLPAAVGDEWAPRLLQQGVRCWDASGHLAHLPQAVALAERTPDDLLMVAADGVAMALAPVLSALIACAQPQALTLTALMPAALKGRGGVRELAGQTGDLLNGRGATHSVWPQTLSFNVHPADSRLEADGLSRTERRILKALTPLLPPEAPAVGLRAYAVPVFYGLTVDVRLLAQRALDLASVMAHLSAVQGVEVDTGTDWTTLPTPQSEGLSERCVISRLVVQPDQCRLTLMVDPLQTGIIRPMLDALLHAS